MKSRFNMASDDQVTPADDELTPADDQVTPADDELTPADDQVTQAADSYQSGPGDQEVPAVEEEHMLPDDDQVVLVVEDDQVLAEDDQGAPGYADDRAADAAASTPAAESAGESSDGRWHEIQAMFVDDPRASVEQAAAVVNDGVETFVSSVKDRQSSLHSAWQGNDADTEQLRTALQQYRDFSRNLDDFSRQS